MSDRIRDPDVPPEVVAAQCPDCGYRLGTPREARESGASASSIVCTRCGHGWTEDDPDEVARAWFGWGAYRALREGGHV